MASSERQAVLRLVPAVPRIGTKVNVDYTTGPSEGTVAYADGTKIWVAYPEMLDCPSDCRGTWCHRNLAVLVKPGNPVNYRLPPASLRRLAVSGGIVEAGPSTAAYDAVVWHEPIDWAVQKQRATVTVVDNHSTVRSREYAEKAYARGARASKRSPGSPRSVDCAGLLDQLHQYIERSAPKGKLTVFRNSLSSHLTGVESKLQNAKYNDQRLSGDDVARLREFVGSQQEQDKFLASFAPDVSKIMQKDQEEEEDQEGQQEEERQPSEQAACGAPSRAVSESEEDQEDMGSKHSGDEDENVSSSDDDHWSASNTEESGTFASNDRAQRRPPIPPVVDPPPRRLWRLTPLQTARARVGSVSKAPISPMGSAVALQSSHHLDAPPKMTKLSLPAQKTPEEAPQK